MSWCIFLVLEGRYLDVDVPATSSGHQFSAPLFITHGPSRDFSGRTGNVSNFDYPIRVSWEFVHDAPAYKVEWRKAGTTEWPMDNSYEARIQGDCKHMAETSSGNCRCRLVSQGFFDIVRAV